MGNIWKITPNAYILSNDVDDTMINTVTLDKDADWEAGFLKTPASKHGSFLGQENHPNDKIYRTTLIDVQGADYINIPIPAHYDSASGGYYKWKIHWYGPNAQLGAITKDTIDFIDYADEQKDFDTSGKFAVPKGAKFVRICIASVLSSGTEQVFPEKTFLADGGLAVQLFNKNSVLDEKASLWLDHETAVTDENGNVSFRAAADAAFHITVRAPGYESVHKTVTSSDYADGLTFTLTVAPHQHPLTKVERTEPTKKHNGNIRHWVCPTCTKYFADEAGREPISQESTLLPPLPDDKNSLLSVVVLPALAICIVAFFLIVKKRKS